MEESKEIQLKRVLALGEILEKLQPIIKGFMRAKDGLASGGRENLMAFAFLERINYNAQGSLPSTIELRYNHHAALPLSHIFRGMIQEIITAYWLFSGEFESKMASLNSEFIVRNDKRLRGRNPSPDEVEMQKMYHGWLNVAPDNFELFEKEDGESKLVIRKEIKFTTFSAIVDSIGESYPDLKMLYLQYTILSQQAHISEFSREIIYRRSGNKIKMFHLACRPILAACIMLVTKVGDAEETIATLDALKSEYFPGEPHN